MPTGFDIEYYGDEGLPDELFALDLEREPHQIAGGPLTETQIRQLLGAVPGSRRAARGVIINGENGAFTHVFGLSPLPDPDLRPEELGYLGVCAKKEILRLRSVRTGHDQLLRIRATTIVASARLQRVFSERRRLWEEKRRIWSLTEYYSTLNAPAKRYISRLSRAHQKIVRPLPLGFSPTHEANAACMKTMVGEIVLVSEMLRHFYYFAVICMMGGDFGIDFEPSVEAGLIAARIIAGNETPDFDLDPRGQLPPEIDRQVWNEVNGMIEFTFGHELAHHLLGHLEAPSNGEPMRIYAHSQEFEADLAAISNVTSASARKDLASAAYRVMFALELIRQLAEVRPEIPSFSVSTTHPSPVERIWALHEGLGRADALRRNVLEQDLATVGRCADILLARLEFVESNTLSVYGSVYMRGLINRMPKDRIEY